MGLSRAGIPQIIINRAAVLSNIIEKYPNISGFITKNKENKAVFELKHNNMKLRLTIDNPSWLTYKWGRKKSEGVLFNRTQIRPLLEVLNKHGD